MEENAKLPPPQKILMTADTLGGVWTYSLELSRALGAYGVEVTLAAMGPAPSSAQEAEAGEIKNLRLLHRPYKLEWMDDPWEDVKDAGEWLLGLEKEIKPRIIHLNGYVHGSLPWNAPCLIVGHSCMLSWWKAVKGKEAPKDWREYRHRVHEGLNSADMVATPTKAMMEQLDYYYGPLLERKLIYNGRDGGRFHKGEKESIVFSAGRLWDEGKNLAVLAKAAPCLRYKFYVCGDDGHPEGGKIKTGNGVNFLGRLSRDELCGWYGKSAVYALPAKYEPFGLTALEAALSGCALVLGDIPPLREIWADAAIFLPPDDAKAWSSAINGLMEDPMKMEMLTEKSTARAKKFSAEKMAEGYLEAYGELCG